MAAVLKYQLPNVSTLNELYEKYPDGGEYGWFAYVATLAKYAYWNASSGLWKATDELPVQPINPAIANPEKVEIYDIPVLKYLKDPAATLNELIERYPDGGEYGWFALIHELGLFAVWDHVNLKWKCVKGEGSFYGGLLSSEEAMDAAEPGKYYSFVLQELSVDLNATNGSLLVMAADDADTIIQIAYVQNNGVKVYTRLGRLGDYQDSPFTQITGSGGGITEESDPIFGLWLQNTPPVLVSDNKVASDDTTAVTVGGLTAGTNLQNKTPLQILELMLYPELFQTASGIVAPSQTFVISPSATYQEVGTTLSILLDASFNRGSISPQYQSASPYRSGELLYHEFNGAGLVDPVEQQTDYTITEYVIELGVNSWTCKSWYSAGVQPKGSKGTNTAGYTALASGVTSTITRTINGVYPVYATTVAIAILTKQTLLAHGADITVSMVAESTGKQTIRIPQAWGTITTLQQYNTLSGSWDTISLATFTKTAVNVTVNGNTVAYWEYVHNGSTIGARQLKFKV